MATKQKASYKREQGKRKTKKRKGTEVILVGTKGHGKTMSTTQALKKGMKLPDPPKKFKKIKIDTTKVGAFLKSLNEAEWGYLQNTIGVSFAIQRMIKHFGITKERFCNEVKIKKSQYKDYVYGNRNYDLQFISRLEAFNKELLKMEAEKVEIVSVVKGK